MTCIRNFIALATACSIALGSPAAFAKVGERDDTYFTLLDCAAVDIVESVATDDTAQKAAREERATRWTTVAIFYSQLPEDQFDVIRIDHEAATRKVYDLSLSSDRAGYRKLQGDCKSLEPAMQDAHAAMMDDG